MATKKNPDDVPPVPVPVPPAAPEASAPAAAEPAAPAEVPTPPPAPYGAPEAPAAERPDPYAAPPAPPASGYSAPPASGYAAPPAAPYGAPAAPYGGPATPYGGQQPYSPGAYAPPGPAQGLSLAAMITGIAGAFLSLFSFGFLPALAAVILGHIASKRQPYAKPFWLTGIITGYVGIGISLLWSLVWVIPFILFLVGAAAAGTTIN